MWKNLQKTSPLVFVLMIAILQSAWAVSSPHPSRTVYQPVPINVAEAIIEPFWSPGLSGLSQWTIDPGPDHGRKLRQNWSAVDFEWASRPVQGPVLRMGRKFNVNSKAYDRLIVRMTGPPGSVLRVLVMSELGRHEHISEPETQNGTEHVLELLGARLIKSIALEIRTQVEGPGTGWLRWIGLQDSKRLSDYQARWDYSRFQWDAHLKEVNEIASFEPQYGIFLNTKELAELRAQSVVIQGESGQVTLEAPADCTIRIDQLPLAGAQTHHRIAIRKTGTQGVLEVKVQLRIGSGQSKLDRPMNQL